MQVFVVPSYTKPSWHFAHLFTSTVVVVVWAEVNRESKSLVEGCVGAVGCEFVDVDVVVVVLPPVPVPVPVPVPPVPPVPPPVP